MTVRELFREFAAYRLRVRDECDRDLTHAWHVNSIRLDIENKQKLPALRDYLKGHQVEKRQTMKEARATLEVLSATYGIPLRKGGKRLVS